MHLVINLNFIAIFLIFNGCKSSEFTGSKKQTGSEAPPSAAPAPTSVPQLPNQTSPPNQTSQPPTCIDDGSILARTLTQSILNGKPNQFVVFEMSLKNCTGGEKYIQTNEIRFDYNAYLSGGVPNNLNYKLKTRDQQILAGGAMDRVVGSDLFGNNSATRFYWRTAGDLRIPPSTVSLYLEIDVSNLEFHVGLFGGHHPPTEQIDMYLSFANAAPVTTSITYQNN